MDTKDEFYEKYLSLLLDRLDEGMKISNKLNGTKAAYMFLAIRKTDNAKGNIDIISNITEGKIEYIQEAEIQTIKN